VTDNLRGIIAVLIASAAFVINDAIVKLVSAELPSGEIIVVRGVLATILLTAGVVALGATRPVSVLMTRMMLMRLVAAGAATTFIVISLRYVPLATVNTVLQAAWAQLLRQMQRVMSDSIMTFLYGRLRGWLDQRARRRESLRIIRLRARAEQRLR